VEKNYNSGGVVADETAKDARTAHVTLYHDAAHPSALEIPVVPREGFRLPPLPQNELGGAASRLRRGAGLFLEPLPEPLPSNLSGNFERLDALHLCLEGLGRVPEVHRALRVEPKLRRVLSSARREDPKAARIRRERSRRSGARGGGRQRRA
jgi:hypothetical protein